MATTLKAHRERLGLSQSQVARRAGLTEITVRFIEQGRSIPKLATARELATALDVPLDELFPPEDTKS